MSRMIRAPYPHVTTVISKTEWWEPARATLYLSSTGVDTTARHTTSALFLYQTVDLLRIHY